MEHEQKRHEKHEEERNQKQAEERQSEQRFSLPGPTIRPLWFLALGSRCLPFHSVQSGGEFST